jgi:N-hydroxyarylamine O-acetyltransferase
VCLPLESIVDVRAYFDRIGYVGDATPTLETLRAMHRAHWQNVPFENLDISRGVEIVADDEGVIFEKVVRRGRGGFCLELTGLFARALRQVGFTLDVIGARVFMEGRLSEPMSHMTLVVHLDEDWIADVGFGGRISMPLRLNETADQFDGTRRYTVGRDGDHWFVGCEEPGTPPGAYVFTMQPREFDEFRDVCRWLQTSPDSRFTHGDIVSLAAPSGRLTLAGGRLIVIDGESREEREVAAAEHETVLRERFRLVV